MLAGFLVLGLFFVAGRRVPSALFLGLAAVPASVGLYGAARVIATRDQLPELDPEMASGMRRFLADIACPIGAFGLVASGCAFLVALVVAVLAHRAALAERGLDAHRLGERSSGRVFAAVAVSSCSLVAAFFIQGSGMLDSVFFHHERLESVSLAVVTTCALAVLATGLVARRIDLLERVNDERERGWLWRRAAMVPVGAALAVVCFESSRFFGAAGRRSGLADVIIEGLVVLMTGAVPLLRATAARKSGLQTIGLAFALSCTVLVGSLAGLLLTAARLDSSEAEIARVTKEADDARRASERTHWPEYP